MKLADFLGFFRKAFSLVEETHQNKKLVGNLEKEVDRLSEALRRAILQIEHLKETERLEREKLILQLQNL